MSKKLLLSLVFSVMAANIYSMDKKKELKNLVMKNTSLYGHCTVFHIFPAKPGSKYAMTNLVISAYNLKDNTVQRYQKPTFLHKLTKLSVEKIFADYRANCFSR